VLVNFGYLDISVVCIIPRRGEFSPMFCSTNTSRLRAPTRHTCGYQKCRNKQKLISVACTPESAALCGVSSATSPKDARPELDTGLPLDDGNNDSGGSDNGNGKYTSDDEFNYDYHGWNPLKRCVYPLMDALNPWCVAVHRSFFHTCKAQRNRSSIGKSKLCDLTSSSFMVSRPYTAVPARCRRSARIPVQQFN
jgi:hypothetical protein